MESVCARALYNTQSTQDIQQEAIMVQRGNQRMASKVWKNVIYRQTNESTASAKSH